MRFEINLENQGADLVDFIFENMSHYILFDWSAYFILFLKQSCYLVIILSSQ